MMLGEMERRTENHLDRPSDGGQQCKVWVEARNQQYASKGQCWGCSAWRNSSLGDSISAHRCCQEGTEDGGGSAQHCSVPGQEATSPAVA